MKKIYLLTIISFYLILFIPLCFFNFDENYISNIDNTYLPNNPFCDKENFQHNFEEYISKRIGFREIAIPIAIRINRNLFGVMDHPWYDFGKEDFVFFKDKNGGGETLSDYHRKLAVAIGKMNEYCNNKDIRFLFVFEPLKNSIYQDKLPKGIIDYNNGWVNKFLQLIQDEGVNVVNNTEFLLQKKEEGICVFNKQYNAGHWNDLGAFFGVNNILTACKVYYPQIHINELDEFLINEKHNTSLQGVPFPINEYEPIFELKTELIDLTENYNSTVERNPKFPDFGYFINKERKNENSPKVLVFQGSYMNGMGYKFFQNSLGEYIYVHDYQNVLNIDYYVNLFQPDMVIFEVAEYTISDYYFSDEKLTNFSIE